MNRLSAARLTLGLTLLSAMLATAAVAQTPPPPPTAPTPPSRPDAGSRPARDPAQFVDVLMNGDKNGDGKLTSDEMPPGLGERLMENADTNKDGALDRAELTAFAQSQGRGGRPDREPGERGPGERGPRAGGGGPQSLDGAMKQANRAVRALKGSAFDASSRKGDLDAIQALEAALIAAKGFGPPAEMSPQATEKFGDDRVAYETAFRRQLLRAVGDAIAVELAVLDGKGADAKAALAKLESQEEAGHKLFTTDEGGEG